MTDQVEMVSCLITQREVPKNMALTLVREDSKEELHVGVESIMQMALNPQVLNYLVSDNSRYSAVVAARQAFEAAVAGRNQGTVDGFKEGLHRMAKAMEENPGMSAEEVAKMVMEEAMNSQEAQQDVDSGESTEDATSEVEAG